LVAEIALYSPASATTVSRTSIILFIWGRSPSRDFLRELRESSYFSGRVFVSDNKAAQSLALVRTKTASAAFGEYIETLQAREEMHLL